MKRLFLVFCFMPFIVMAQHSITLDEALKLALERNPAVTAAQLNTDRERALRGTAFDLPKTTVSLMYGQYNSLRNDNNVTILQEIPFPAVFVAQSKTNSLRVEASRLRETVTAAQLQSEVRRTFNLLLYLKQNEQLLMKQDSLYSELTRIARIQYKTGEGTLLQLTAAESQHAEILNRLIRNRADYSAAMQQLRLYCQSDSLSAAAGDIRNLVQPDRTGSAEQSPAVGVARQNINLRAQEKRLEASRLYPDLIIGYFTQTLAGPQQINGTERYFDRSTRFTGVQVGVAIPLFFNSGRARVKAAATATRQAQKEYESAMLTFSQYHFREQQQLEKNKMSINYYETLALAHADLLENQSRRAFAQGELDYATLLLNLRQALQIREGYLTALYDYNESAILLLLLTGK